MSRRFVAIAAAACAALLACASAGGQPRTLVITTARAFGPLGRPGVPFPHGLHENIPRQGCAACHHHGSDARGYTGCAACHAGKAEIRTAFHRSCVGCHDAAARQGSSAVPRACAECHPRGGKP